MPHVDDFRAAAGVTTDCGTKPSGGGPCAAAEAAAGLSGLGASWLLGPSAAAAAGPAWLSLAAACRPAFEAPLSARTHTGSVSVTWHTATGSTLKLTASTRDAGA